MSRFTNHKYSFFFFGENIPYASLDDSGVQQPVEL